MKNIIKHGIYSVENGSGWERFFFKWRALRHCKYLRKTYPVLNCIYHPYWFVTNNLTNKEIY
jgi:hypothetical protein